VVARFDEGRHAGTRRCDLAGQLAQRAHQPLAIIFTAAQSRGELHDRGVVVEGGTEITREPVPRGKEVAILQRRVAQQAAGARWYGEEPLASNALLLIRFECIVRLRSVGAPGVAAGATNSDGDLIDRRPAGCGQSGREELLWRCLATMS
jgi:hypothetical protein